MQRALLVQVLFAVHIPPSLAVAAGKARLHAGSRTAFLVAAPLSLHSRIRLAEGFRVFASASAMGMVPEKRTCPRSGIKYRLDSSSNGGGSPSMHAIFLHGLGSSSETCTVPDAVLSMGAQWIVPDLVGHGDSPRPDDAAAYTMQRQAEVVHGVLIQEKVKRLLIVAHSMSGPIAALGLLDLCKATGIDVVGLVYEEGNIDFGDCFGSQKLVDAGPGPSLESVALYHSAVDLVRVSKDETTWPRLKRAMDDGLEVKFTFGEKNRGRFTSEALLRDAGVDIEWCPNGGHSMHMDEGHDHFWGVIGEMMTRCIR